MDKKIRLGIVGFAHMHITQMVDSFLAKPDVFEWVGCADLPPKVAPISSESGTRKRNIENITSRCGMTLSQEKAILLILTPADLRLPILKAICETVMKETGEHAVAISLPVDAVEGLAG